MDALRGDRTLIMITLLLLVLGLVMVYSASAILASHRYDDSMFFFKRQVVWAAIGLAVMIGVSHVPYTFWETAALPLVLFSAILLGLVFVPGIGVEINGSQRWLRLGPMTLQPSELARVGVVIYLARYLARNPNRMESFSKGLLPPMLIIGSLLALILMESDLGTAAVMAMVAGLMLFAGGVRWRHLGVLGLVAVPVVIAMIMAFGYRRERLTSFLDPWRDPLDSGFQIIQSFLALGSGGSVGTGLGEGHQKLFFLPYPHTDFIFAVIGEELGLVGTMGVVILFGLLAWQGLTIALKSQDLFGRYLAFGLTVMVATQAFVNMAVVTGLLPTKGLTLPFLSYGGSSLLANLLAIGIIRNVSEAVSGRRSNVSVGPFWNESKSRPRVGFKRHRRS